MKILMTADAVGGVWTYALELSRALARFDVEIVLAVMGPPPTRTQQATADALANVQLLRAPWKLEWMQDPWDDVERAGEWLLHGAQREQVDLIHLNGYAHASLPWSRPVVVVAHSCVCSWWQAVHGEPAPATWASYRQAVEAGLAAADRVVAPTHAFLRMIEAQYGALPRTRVIYNARAPAARAKQRTRQPEIFACGRIWDEAKNFAVLDAATHELPWATYVAGDTVSPEGRAQSLASLHCLGRLSEQAVDEWLERVGIFAHPAVYEPFGLSVLAAAQHGRALVLSDIPTLCELWEGAALFAAPRDAHAFRTQLVRLIEHPSEREDLGRAAYERAQRFGIEPMVGAYRALYADLLQTRATKEYAVA